MQASENLVFDWSRFDSNERQEEEKIRVQIEKATQKLQKSVISDQATKGIQIYIEYKKDSLKYIEQIKNLTLEKLEEQLSFIQIFGHETSNKDKQLHQNIQTIIYRLEIQVKSRNQKYYNIQEICSVTTFILAWTFVIFMVLYIVKYIVTQSDNDFLQARNYGIATGIFGSLNKIIKSKSIKYKLTKIIDYCSSNRNSEQREVQKQ